MPTVQQKTVFSQTNSTPHVLSRDGCGLNTIKNSILSLLLAKGSINATQFDQLSKSKELVKSLYDQLKERISHENGDIDISIAKLGECIELLRLGMVDLNKFGITSDMLYNLNLEMNGSQDITLINDFTGGMIDVGLLGFESDLYTTSSLAKLARQKGEYTHAFAFGLDNIHWVTAVVHQNADGERSWTFMDSYNNQTIHKDAVIARLEAVLSKSEPALKTYLVQAYDNCSDMVTITHRYNDFFGPDNKPIDGAKVGDKTAKEFYIDHDATRNDYINYITDRAAFMENAGWFSADLGDEEMLRVTKLHALTKFMVDNAADDHHLLKARFNPILEKLEQTIALNKPDVEHEADLDVTTPEVTDTITDPLVSDVDQQAQQALNAVENGTPQPTASFMGSLVQGIRNVYDWVCEKLSSIGQAISSMVSVRT